MSSSCSTPFLSSLLDLADLPLRAKSSNNVVEEDIHMKAEELVNGLLEYSNSSQDRVLKESMANVMSKVEVILREIISIDKANAECYEELVKKVTDFKLEVEKSSVDVITSSSPSTPTPMAADICCQESDSDEQPEIENLSKDEQNCLFCFSELLSACVEIKKRDLILWWVGLLFVRDSTVGDEILDKLVAKGFIYNCKKTVNSKIYKIPKSVRSKVQQTSSGNLLKAKKEDPFCLMHYGNEVVGFLNLNERIFDFLETLPMMFFENARVVCLGSNKDSSDQSVVADNKEVLQACFRAIGKVAFLSLRGISGIVKLPESVCMLKGLKVLDLRDCNNLELLPQGIGSLKQLVYLDLSECYLLDHIPKEISLLRELRVLKGFVINPQDPSLEARESKDHATPKCAGFCDLSELQELRKLTVRTRRMNFPTRKDLQTLCHLNHLNNLKIAWVGSHNVAQIDGNLERFPATVKKLELQTAPARTVSRLLGLISTERNSHLEKLCVKGGGISELNVEKHCLSNVKVVRLRYLSKLDIDWDEFIKCFPKLISLEVFKCPHLSFFPCDKNGKWERPWNNSRLAL